MTAEKKAKSGNSPRVISIDPGLEKVAWAEWDFETGKLVEAGLIQRKAEVGEERAEKWRKMAYQVDYLLFKLEDREILLVIEIPQVYSGPREEDPNDLIDLAGVVGAITGKIINGHVEWSPTPREWKGQIKKEISKQRVDQRLSQDEKAKILWPIKSLAHNVYDALHLGIVYLEREGLRDRQVTQLYPKKV